ncbi:MOSC domain-containing protein [Arthroderma uncinatum]|uniref:MOSC domain-containing protein n=1 Tax=Arthroderma uncinatum TaxID=74035 RepID=UPI00144ABDEE|nr:MOSC domain-containing protein [Arthroderma uncinatum]KAF3480562.1 MOSC domain-containing protein [Arthroderma uncinatum]
MFFIRGLVPRLNLPVPVALAMVYIFFLGPLVLMLYYELKSRRERAHTPKGCRKLGLHDNHSNLSDEAAYGTDGNKDDKKETEARVKALIIYPIKSCQGIEFNRTEFEDSGLAWDRQFCFAEYTTNSEGGGRWDAKTLRDGKFSRLALIRAEIWVPDPSSEGYDTRLRSVKSGGVLIIYFPRDTRSLSLWTQAAIRLGLADSEEFFSIPLNPPDTDEYPLESIRLFTIPTKGTQYTTHLPASLSRFLECKKPLSLFRVHASHSRVAGGNAPTEQELGFAPRMAFSDLYPLQVQSMGSIRDMAGRTRYAIPHLSVRRFRPNIVVEGVGAYEEDAWKMVRLVPDDGGEEGVEIHVSCRTVRCKLPNVDPDTGERHAVEPDKTLRGTRAIDEGASGGCLGMMLVPTKPRFTIRVGDRLEVLSTGKHFYRK